MTLLRSFLLVSLLVLATPAGAGRGEIVASRNLDQLTDTAAFIVRGHVTSTRLERHPVLGVEMVVVTVRVSETLKGPVRGTLTFRQHISDFRDRIDHAGYLKGQDMLLMMIAPSQYGLSSPAGSTQGRFRISRDAAGREVAINGHGNYRLFDGVGAGAASKGAALSSASIRLVQSRPRGPVALDELTGLIRELAAGSP